MRFLAFCARKKYSTILRHSPHMTTVSSTIKTLPTADLVLLQCARRESSYSLRMPSGECGGGAIPRLDCSACELRRSERVALSWGRPPSEFTGQNSLDPLPAAKSAIQGGGEPQAFLASRGEKVHPSRPSIYLGCATPADLGMGCRPPTTLGCGDPLPCGSCLHRSHIKV